MILKDKTDLLFIVFKKKMKLVSLVLFISIMIIILFSVNGKAQSLKDSIRANHSPHKATIYSLVLPGLGQAYNQQYWKVPILYAGIATIAYFAVFNTERYHLYRTEFVARINGDTLSLNPKYALYSDNTVLQLKNYYQRNLEFTYIMAGVVYLLNLIDASVYAHLFSFDVGNDLSLRVDPMINNNTFSFDNPPSAGVRLTLKF